MTVTKTEATRRIEDILNKYEEAWIADPTKYTEGIRIQVDEYTVACLRRLLRDAWSHT